MRRLALGLLLLVLAAGCGDDDDDGSVSTPLGDLPACSDVFVDGQVVTAEQWDNGCAQPDGELVGSAFYDCEDGTHLSWSDLGWGYQGEAFHTGDFPESVLDACFGS